VPLTNEEFDKVRGRLDHTALSILMAKGPDYAGHDGDNRLANFESVAQLLKGAPMDAATVAAVYWLKHVFAICTYIRTRRPGSEPILGRFADDRNYNALLWACLVAGTDQDVTKELEDVPGDDLERVFRERCLEDPGFLHRFLLALKEEVQTL